MKIRRAIARRVTCAGNRSSVCRWAVLGLGGLLSLAVIAGCGSSASPSSSGNAPTASFYTGWPTGGKPQRGGTITYATGEVPNTLNPYTIATDQNALAQVFDSLVESVPGSKSESELQPGLATSWSVSPDHLTWTFHIRENVRFSNGEPVTGEDVVFSLQQEMLPTSGFHFLIPSWTKVSLAGPMTVHIHLSKPQPILPEVVSNLYFAIVPKAVYQREGEKGFGLHPIGTGPFKVSSASAGFAEIVEKRNPYYWRSGKPYLDGIVFKQIESSNARVIAARSGTASIAGAIPYSQASSLKSMPDLKLLVGPVWGASYNFFNRSKAPFNEVNVRRALMYATPVAEIIKSVYKGFGTQANSPWGQLNYWDSKVPYYPYDIAKAKELLKKSTVPNGFNTVIEVTGGETEGEALATILQAAWARIGVHASIDLLSSATLSANFFAGKYDFTVWPPQQGFSFLYEPDGAVLVYFTTSEPGFGPKASPAFVAKAEKATSSSDQTQRSSLFGELQYDAYWKEAYFMPVVNLVSFNLVSDTVRGFQELPDTIVPMQNVWLQQ